MTPSPPSAALGDLAERAFWTFLQVFLTVLTGDALIDLSVNALETAALAGFGAVLSLIKSFAAQRLDANTGGALAPWETPTTGTP